MEFVEVIKTRRSTREFSIEPISKDMVKRLIDSARLAPSAKNRQNWMYVILENDKKDNIANIMLKEYQKETAKMESDNATLPHRAASSVLNSIRVIKEAPILILVFREYDKDWTEGDYLSIGASIENLCLRATDLELATLWIRDVIYTREEITNAIFDKDKNMELISGVAVGYSTEFPYERRKKKLEDIMIWM